MAAELSETPEIAGLSTGGEVKSAVKMQRTMTAAMAALRGFSGAPGRKAASCCPAAGRSRYLPTLFPQLIDTANRLGYTLYPVDVVGGRDLAGRLHASLSGWLPVVADNGLISSERSSRCTTASSSWPAAPAARRP